MGLASPPGLGLGHLMGPVLSRHHTLGASGHSSVRRHRPDCEGASLSAHCLQLPRKGLPSLIASLKWQSWGEVGCGVSGRGTCEYVPHVPF